MKRFAAWAKTNPKPRTTFIESKGKMKESKVSKSAASGSQCHPTPGDSSDTSFSMVDDQAAQEMMRLRQELEEVTKEKLELELSLSRAKSRKEM